MRKPSLENEPNARGNAIRQIFTETDKRTIYIPAPHTSRKSSSRRYRFARHQPFLLVDNRVFARFSRKERPMVGASNRMHRDTIRNLIALRLLSLSLPESWKRFTFLYARLVSRIRDRFPASWHLLSCGLLEKTTSRLSTMNTKHQTGCILASTIAICICSPRCRINLDFFFLFFFSFGFLETNNVKFFAIKVFVIEIVNSVNLYIALKI